MGQCLRYQRITGKFCTPDGWKISVGYRIAGTFESSKKTSPSSGKRNCSRKIIARSSGTKRLIKEFNFERNKEVSSLDIPERKR